MNCGKNVCFFTSVIQVLYSLPLFRDCINKFLLPVKGVGMKIINLFGEIEISSEPVRLSKYLRYLGLEHYGPWIQYDAHECLLQFLAKNYPNIDDCMYKINNKLESMLCNDYGHSINKKVRCYIKIWIQGENTWWLQLCRWMSKVEYINKSCLYHAVIWCTCYITKHFQKYWWY